MMRIAHGLALVVITGAAFGLAACGGSGSAGFASKVKESCEKSPQSASIDCECLAATLDKELDEKAKSIMLAVEAATAAGKSSAEALKDAGVSEADAPALMSQMVPAITKASQNCAKKS